MKGAGVEQLRVRAGIDLERTALVFEDRRRSHGALRERAARVAAGLSGLGVQRGEPVAVLSGNCLEYVEVEAGIDLAGALTVHLDPRLPAPGIAALLRRSGAHAVFVEGSLLPVLGRLRRAGEAPLLRTIVALGAGPGDLDYEELCAATASSPVGQVGAATPAVRALAGTLCLGRDCSTYVVADLARAGRDELIWPLLCAGGEVHLRRSGPFAARSVLGYLGRHGITHVVWTPAMLRAVLDADALGGRDTRRLRAVVCAGGAPAAALVAEAQRALPDATVVLAPPSDCRFGQFTQ